MRRFDGPGWRLLGAASSWLLFAFCFTLLLQSSLVVMGLGGFCASGGAYEIRVECPEAVVASTPLSIFGGFVAVGLALGFAKGFGLPLIVWGWPILFVGLGIAFLQSGVEFRALGFLVPGVLFVLMGFGPLVLVLRSTPQSAFLGSRSLDGRRFVERVRGEQIVDPSGGPHDDDARLAPTAGHLALALAAGLVPAATGVYFAVWVFTGAAPFG